MVKTSFEYIAHKQEKTPRITGTQGENEHGDPIFLLQLLSYIYMTDICAKFEKSLDSPHHFQANDSEN